MKNELFLPHRIIYSVLFPLLATSAAGVSHSTQTLVTLVAFAFIGSFVWQYKILHTILRRLSISRRLRFVIFVWGISSLAILLSFFELTHFVNAQFAGEQSEITKEVAYALATRFILFGIAVQLFVAGACTWRAFRKHGALWK